MTLLWAGIIVAGAALILFFLGVLYVADRGEPGRHRAPADAADADVDDELS